MTPFTNETRRDRQLRIARKRGDRLAVAVLETRAASIQRIRENDMIRAGRLADRWLIAISRRTRPDWTETELRALWGDR